MEPAIPLIYTSSEQKKLQECDDALFGSWDMEVRKRLPGLVEKVNSLSLMIKVIGGLATFTFLHDLGIPTQDILPFLGKIVASVIGS